MHISNLLAVCALALATMGLGAALPRPRAVLFFSQLLTLIAGVYLGFALLEVPSRHLKVEGGVAVLFLGLGVLGASGRPRVLALAFVAHALWDVLHQPGLVTTPVPDGYPAICVLYDVLVGAFIAWLSRGGTGTLLRSRPGAVDVKVDVGGPRGARGGAGRR